MATVRIDYFGMEGEGPTLTAAKKDAGAKIQAALSGYYTPEVVAYRGWAALVYRTPDGWHSGMLTGPKDGEDYDNPVVKHGDLSGTSWDGDKESALRSARLHVAQLGWRHEDGEVCPPLLTDRKEQADFLSWVKFQLRYRQAKNAGLNDHDCHHWGGNWWHDDEMRQRFVAAGLLPAPAALAAVEVA